MFTKLINYIVMASLLFSTTLFPATQAYAAACSVNSSSSSCYTKQIGTTTVRVPRLAWTTLGTWKPDIGWVPAGLATAQIGSEGQRAVVTNNVIAQVLGLPSDMITQAVSMFAGSPPLVVARYNQSSALLKIDVIRTVKSPSGDYTVYMSSFGPEQGEMWKVARAFLSSTEYASESTAGINPFEVFKGADDNFHNISFEGAQVAVGHAMRHYGTDKGIIVGVTPRMSQEQKKSGNMFRKKITTIIKGFAKPEWYLAGLPSAIPDGVSAAICVANEDPCQKHHIAASGIAVKQYVGGNMPGQEDQLYHWQQTKSGFTFLTFAIFAFFLSFAAFSLTGTGAGWMSSLATSPTYGLGITGLNAATVGLLDGIGYLIGGAVMQGGSPTDIQSGYMGKKLSTGSLSPSGASDEHSRGLMANINCSHIDLGSANSANCTAVPASKVQQGLSGYVQAYQGECPAGLTASECTANGYSNKGFVPRADEYVEHNAVLFSKEFGKPTGLVDY